MASRAGQKGTIGLIIPEDDMPFTSDGIRPDLIINPHAIPSRMTVGQLIESMFGKACCSYGGFGDCTAFTTKGSNVNTYGYMLAKAGFHSSGNQLLYNGMTGEQLRSDIYIGPTYYMRLKHMVKDKINYRARGPRTALTRQTVQGRANDGGLRVGEMERDAIISHGAAGFLSESFLVRGDEYYMAVCNKTGMIAIYNPAQNIFLSPGADGPVKFHTTMDGKMTLEMVSQYGRSFSILRIPYSLKLLIQELQVMNIQMRIITNENVDTLMSMSYSDNIIKVTNDEVKFQGGKGKEGDDYINQYVREYKRTIDKLFSKESGKRGPQNIPSFDDAESSEYRPDSAPDGTISSDSIPRKVDTASDSESESMRYTPPIPPPSETISSTSSGSFVPPPPADSPNSADFGSEELNEIYRKLGDDAKQKLAGLTQTEQIAVLRKVAAKRKETEPQEDSTAILNVENLDEKEEDENKKSEESSSSSSQTKSVTMDDNKSSASGETKQITL
jgi:DNA-directed RNA polymerase II subunit RPB2